MRAIVVVTTVGTEEQANLIAREIIARRQAACVNIVPAIRSIYRWKGKICKDGELLLIVKTLEDEFDAVASTIRELHSYELPEILSFGISRGDQRFLDWIASSVDKDAEFLDDEEEDEIAYAADLDDSDF
jgi:periplasmic divalent cation tolerance protein